MTTRLIIAYSLMALMAVVAAAVVAWNAYHSRPRMEARRRKRSADFYDSRDKSDELAAQASNDLSSGKEQ